MSGTSAASQLLSDPGVLAAQPLLAVHTFACVRRLGGAAVLPWRAAALAARAEGVTAVPSCAGLGPFEQAAVVAEKSRQGTLVQVAAAARQLAPGGRLVVVGGNEVGIATTLRRITEWSGVPAEIVSNRRRARAAVFRIGSEIWPEPDPPPAVQLPADFGGLELTSAAGVFSSERLDRGSARLLVHLDREPGLAAVDRILDLGAGIGVLAFAALARAQRARAWLGEADHRAVACARINAERHGFAERVECAWWDAAEALPEMGADLVLCNPPFHAGVAVDLAAAHRMFAAIRDRLAPGGRALIVANRHLPYERDLGTWAAVEQLDQAEGFKILRLRHRH